MEKPKIRHLAIMTPEPDKLAAFYVNVFEMEIVHRSKGKDGKGGVYLSDGYMSLAILPHRTAGEAAPGLNHFGFEIEDLDEITKRLVAEGVEEPTMRPAHRPYAEHRAADPYGNGFDLSEHGYQSVEYAAERQKRKALKKEKADA